MTIETYLIYLAALAAFFATPPDVSQFLIMSNSIRHGLRRSTATIAGDLTANTLQMTAAAFGLTALIATSASAIFWIKWAGVAYLVWLGIRLLISKPASRGVSAGTSANARALFQQGFFTSMANPYAVIFFGALFPQFIDVTAPVLPQLLILGTTYLVVDGVLLFVWGFAAERTARRVGQSGGAWANRVSGFLMIAAATLLAAKDLKITEPVK